MRTNKYLLGLCILVLALSTVCFGFGSPVTPIEKIGKTIEKRDENSCFLIGSFTLLHKTDPSIVPATLAEDKSPLNMDCRFNTFMEIVNPESQKKYAVGFKPIAGSNPRYYNSKKFAENGADPYWILEVPAGTYQLDTIVAKYSIHKDGYEDYFSHLFDVPVSRVVQQKIFIDAKAGQIVYIGDFEANLTTHILLDNQNRLYPFRMFNMALKNNFDAAKTALMEKVDEKTKAKLSQMEIVSALAN